MGRTSPYLGSRLGLTRSQSQYLPGPGDEAGEREERIRALQDQVSHTTTSHCTVCIVVYRCEGRMQRWRSCGSWSTNCKRSCRLGGRPSSRQATGSSFDLANHS